ncbi:hypothetical protein CDAR_279671 [Caerostris darwini]|uniref:Uncharacterized protein n=1 Tax=Caerostris darwini TaxID=1538125 RepID=A0AAV4VF90_9ARAC|nr:hypothetical protein CDAR_279671 [Caerostris darwini]
MRDQEGGSPEQRPILALRWTDVRHIRKLRLLGEHNFLVVGVTVSFCETVLNISYHLILSLDLVECGRIFDHDQLVKWSEIASEFTF